MYLYPDELRTRVRLSHLYKAVAHTKADLDNTAARRTKLVIPVKCTLLCGEPVLREALIPAALLTGRHTPGPHHEAADTRR
jgi:hypothetical protein